jgi:hypothetical protein
MVDDEMRGGFGSLNDRLNDMSSNLDGLGNRVAAMERVAGPAARSPVGPLPAAEPTNRLPPVPGRTNLAHFLSEPPRVAERSWTHHQPPGREPVPGRLVNPVLPGREADTHRAVNREPISRPRQTARRAQASSRKGKARARQSSLMDEVDAIQATGSEASDDGNANIPGISRAAPRRKGGPGPVARLGEITRVSLVSQSSFEELGLF